MGKTHLACGDKYGCFTIQSISEMNSGFPKRVYTCRCECGRVYKVEESRLKKKRYCFDPECDLKIAYNKKISDSYRREKHESYDIGFLNTMYGTLEIVECIDDQCEGNPEVWGRKKGDGRVCIYKKYKCRCVLCKREYEYKSSDFKIGLVTQNGIRKYHSIAHCEYCETYKSLPSSFEWRTEKILRDNSIKYRREFSFPDLYGNWGINLLRYDFAIYDSDGNMKCLVECQGEQHSKPIESFGGIKAYGMQRQNDQGKKMYAEEHGITLIEIPNTCDTLEKEIRFLQSEGIIR